MDDVVATICKRIHAEFDGECHLTEAEANDVIRLITRLCADLEEARKALEAARAVHFEQAAQIVEAEPEFVDPPESYIITAMEMIGPVENARIACRTTKTSIAAAIRKEGERPC